MIFILLGPPGSGKGTQSARLSKKFDFEKISTGDLLRAEVKEGTELGLRVKNTINRGELVSDELLSDIIRKWLNSNKAKTRLLFDGYPRTTVQAQTLQDLCESKRKIFAIHLHVDMEALTLRLSKRLVCENCKEIFHEVHKQPKELHICDSCGGKVIRREDDQLEKIKKRMEIYTRETEPVLNFYRERNTYKRVNGNRTMTEVANELGNLISDIDGEG